MTEALFNFSTHLLGDLNLKGKQTVGYTYVPQVKEEQLVRIWLLRMLHL